MIDVRRNIHSHSLYSYDGSLRDRIMAAKIHNSWHAMTTLCKEFAANPHALALANDADLIVPAPSSLWGRVRGRFDLAHALASTLASRTKKPLRSMPRGFYFRWTKRAGTNKPEDQLFLSKSQSIHWPDYQNILIVDDIITTGVTLNSLGRAFVQDFHKVSALSLAGSKTIRTSTYSQESLP